MGLECLRWLPFGMTVYKTHVFVLQRLAFFIVQGIQNIHFALKLHMKLCTFRTRTSTGDDTIINDSLYANESFEETTSRQAASKKSAKSPRSPLDHLNRKGLQWLAGRDIRSPRSFNKGRSSESESEESMSHTGKF